jgi:tetratricopeptide (TPR) repeat protein
MIRPAVSPTFERGLEAQRAGQVDDAMAAYRETITEQPDHAPAQFNLGQLLRAAGQDAEAADCFEVAARLRPTAADAWINLGLCRERLGHLDRAAAAYQRAIEAGAADGTPHFNLGNVRRKQDRLSEALDAFREADARHPGMPEVQLNIGNTLREMGRSSAAAAALRRALELRPGWVAAEWNLALALLGAGQLREGWEWFESRWAQIGLAVDRGLPWPLWRGESLEGKRILVWREQGLGDEILFAGCVPDLVEQGAKVTLAVDPRLVSLLARSFPGADVVADRDWDDRLFDYHAPIGGLPRWLRGDRADFPERWSYLQPDRGHLAAWRERLAPLGSGLKVGLCWRSGLRAGGRDRFYCPLDAHDPLFALPDLTWINLQYDDCEAELGAVERRRGVRVHRWDDVDLKHDLERVAALTWHLDLVISAPTAVGSLSGALGIETWQVEAGNDWTGFGERRSPWMPGVTMYRRAPGDRAWNGVIRTIADSLVERQRALPGRSST